MRSNLLSSARAAGAAGRKAPLNSTSRYPASPLSDVLPAGAYVRHAAINEARIGKFEFDTSCVGVVEVDGVFVSNCYDNGFHIVLPTDCHWFLPYKKTSLSTCRATPLTVVFPAKVAFGKPAAKEFHFSDCRQAADGTHYLKSFVDFPVLRGGPIGLHKPVSKASWRPVKGTSKYALVVATGQTIGLPLHSAQLQVDVPGKRTQPYLVESVPGDCGSPVFGDAGVVGVHTGALPGHNAFCPIISPEGGVQRSRFNQSGSAHERADGLVRNAQNESRPRQVSFSASRGGRRSSVSSASGRRPASVAPPRAKAEKSKPEKPKRAPAQSLSKPSREALVPRGRDSATTHVLKAVSESIFTAPSSGSDLLTSRNTAAVATLDGYVGMVVNPWAGAPVRLPDVNITPSAIGKFYANRTYKLGAAGTGSETVLFGMSSRFGRASNDYLYDTSTKTVLAPTTIVMTAGNYSYILPLGLGLGASPPAASGTLSSTALSRTIAVSNVALGGAVFTFLITGFAAYQTTYPILNSASAPVDYGPTLVAPAYGLVGGTYCTLGYAGARLWDVLGLASGDSITLSGPANTAPPTAPRLQWSSAADRVLTLQVASSAGTYAYSPGCIMVPQSVDKDGFMAYAATPPGITTGPWADDYGVEQLATSSWISAYRTLAMAMRFRVIGLPDNAFIAPGKLYVAQIRADAEDVPTTEQDFVVLERMGRASHVSLDAVREAGSKTFFAVPDSADKFNFTSSFAMSPGTFSSRNLPGANSTDPGDSGFRRFPGYADMTWILQNNPGDPSRLIVPYDGRPILDDGSTAYPGGSTSYGIAATADAANADQTTILVAGLFGGFSTGGGPTLEVDYATVLEYIPSSRAPPGIDTRVQLPNAALNDQIFSACAAFTAIRPAMFQMAGDATMKTRDSGIHEASKRAVMESARRGAGGLTSGSSEGLLDWLIGYDNVNGSFSAPGVKVAAAMSRNR